MFAFSSITAPCSLAQLCLFYLLLTPVGSQDGCNMRFYVGTYTKNEAHVPEGKGKGIYLYDADCDTGAMKLISGPYEAGPNPTYIAITANRRRLYATNEASPEPSTVTGFDINDDGSLKQFGSWSTRGIIAAHVSLARNDTVLLCANYGSGSVISYRINWATGSLEEASFHQFHHYSNVVPSRQGTPHAHNIFPGPENVVYVADLGGDRIYKFVLQENGALEPPTRSNSWIPTPPGSGPRTITLTSDGSYAFVSCELSCQLLVYRIIAEAEGALELAAVADTLPPSSYPNPNKTCYVSDVQAAPNDRFVYTANRFQDTMAGFAFDNKAQAMNLIGHTESSGKTVRSFIIDPTGKLMVQANQDSHTLASFKIDEETGALNFTGNTIECPTPAVIVSV